MSELVAKVALFSPGIMFGCLIVFLCLESIYPLRQRKNPFFKRLIINICLSGLTISVASTVVKPAALNLIFWTSERKFGLLQVVSLPSSIKFILGFLLMDLTFYYWHRLNHRVAFFRRFHNVHHIDPDMDVTTSFRFHFGEILYSTLFRVFQVGVIGMSLVTYSIYEMVFTLATMFHHSNLRLPIKFERLLNKIFVTPRMHGIHHSSLKEERNSNYSVIFRWWDVLNRSLLLNVPQAQIVIGIAGYWKPEDNNLINLLSLPFRGARISSAPLRDGGQDRVRTDNPSLMSE